MMKSDYIEKWFFFLCIQALLLNFRLDVGGKRWNTQNILMILMFLIVFQLYLLDKINISTIKLA